MVQKLTPLRFITFRSVCSQAVGSLWWCRYCQHGCWKGFVIKPARQPEDFSKQLLNQHIWALVLGVNVCGLGRSSCLLWQQNRASALWVGVNKRQNGAFGSRLKWAMRQVCAEASNESFAGNLRFLWAKERWGRRQEIKTSWEQKGQYIIQKKRNLGNRSCQTHDRNTQHLCTSVRTEDYRVKLAGFYNPTAAVNSSVRTLVSFLTWLLMLWQKRTFKESSLSLLRPHNNRSATSSTAACRNFYCQDSQH